MSLNFNSQRLSGTRIMELHFVYYDLHEKTNKHAFTEFHINLLFNSGVNPLFYQLCNRNSVTLKGVTVEINSAKLLNLKYCL